MIVVINVNEPETLALNTTAAFLDVDNVDWGPFTFGEFDETCYFGADAPFSSIVLNGTDCIPNVSGDADITILSQYWNGATWAFLPITADGTAAGPGSWSSTDAVQTISFTPPVDWAPTTVQGEGPYYFIRIFNEWGFAPLNPYPAYHGGTLGGLPLDLYGLQDAGSPQLSATLDVTDLSATPEVLRQFPLGEYWNRTVGWLPAVARAIARFFSRLRRVRELLERQYNPRTADVLLPDRERERGVVPVDGQTLDERRAAVLAKMRSEGGVTKAYYTQICVDAGYLDAVVTEAADPFTTVSVADDVLAGGLWMVTMHVTATSLGAAQDQALQDLINGQLQAGFYAIYTFT